MSDAYLTNQATNKQTGDKSFYFCASPYFLPLNKIINEVAVSI